ncbi:kinase-like domain-containing protein [Xylariaceae sp. FL0255]|nr:kinase-like domain-containing protein [Xylariaceae sp. FL0255]
MARRPRRDPRMVTLANNLGLTGLSNHVEENFQNRYWEYEKTLGMGGFGIAVLIKLKGILGPDAKRRAVKLARSGREAELLKEIEILKTINGASHVVSVLGTCDNLLQAVKDRRRGLMRIIAGKNNTKTKNRVQKTTKRSNSSVLWRAGFFVWQQVRRQNRHKHNFPFDSFVGVGGPALALEYLEYGDVDDLKNRLYTSEENPNMPNRVLWSIFLCLIRAVIGMAYPIGQPIGGAQITETIPADGNLSTESKLTHNDIFPRNVMFAAGDGIQEHYIEAMAKLIDFGVANDGEGSPHNLYWCAQVINAIVVRGPLLTFGATWPYKGFPTRGVNLLGYPTPQKPNPLRIPYRWLDPELRDFLLTCLYEDPANRPTLSAALATAQNAVSNKTPDSFPEPARETDDAVRTFMQNFVLNVPRRRW